MDFGYEEVGYFVIRWLNADAVVVAVLPYLPSAGVLCLCGRVANQLGARDKKNLETKVKMLMKFKMKLNIILTETDALECHFLLSSYFA